MLFRQAYDTLLKRLPQRADTHYLRILHRAAGTTEADVEAALSLLLESGMAPTSEAVRELVRPHEQVMVPEVSSPEVDLSLYDQLLSEGRVCE